MQSTKPKVKLIGEDGNAFYILAACKKADKAVYESIKYELMSGDYNHLLAVVSEHYDIH